MDPKVLIILATVLMLCCCSSSTGSLVYSSSGNATGPTGPTGPTGGGGGGGGGGGTNYTKSCDDLGGGVIERKYAPDGIPLTLASCKQTCSADSDCLGFIRQEDGNFCQFHDNKTITNVDVCDLGYNMYRK
tara:strand:- start:188 stop:580 length:393 start_codon:yes stop_codon:yes gene_type:complete